MASLVINVNSTPYTVKVEPEMPLLWVLRGALDLLPVFVGPGQEEDFLAGQFLEAGQGVGDDGRVGVPDVGHVVHVVDRRGDIETVLIAHDQVSKDTRLRRMKARLVQEKLVSSGRRGGGAECFQEPCGD